MHYVCKNHQSWPRRAYLFQLSFSFNNETLLLLLDSDINVNFLEALPLLKKSNFSVPAMPTFLFNSTPPPLSSFPLFSQQLLPQSPLSTSWKRGGKTWKATKTISTEKDETKAEALITKSKNLASTNICISAILLRLSVKLGIYI